MAITKIHAIKSTLGKALAYIENPDKTDGQMLVSGYNCEPQTASIDFEVTAVLSHKARNLKRKRSTNLAYHLIQSFSPEDAVTPEQAHEMGKKLAFEYTGGKYEYVVATHIDKGHIIVLTVPISLLCARKRNRLFDQVTRGITICGICVPTFWLGFLLLLFFAIHLKWFSVLPSPGWRGFLLPSFALAVPSSCSLIRIMRSSLLAELSSDYVRFAKARGLSANRILVCHILRNALPPVVTIFFQQFGFLIAGGAVIESVFSIKGIGTYLVDSVIAADTIAVSTCIVVIAAIFVVANFMADIINRLLCPWMVKEENDT